MRPVASPSGHVKEPLNDILGTPANVRLIRVLSEEATGPIGAPEAAELAGLTETGARQALKRLARTSLVEQVGGGRAQRFRLRESDRITAPLRALFQEERLRYHAFVSGLRTVFTDLAEVNRAWMQEPTDSYQPVNVGILAASSSLGYLREQARHRVLPIEKEFDTTIELQLYSRVDLPNIEWGSTTPIAGYSAESTTPTPVESDRRDRALRWSNAIAAMLEQTPSLLKRAIRHLDLLLQEEQGPSAHDLSEWRDILAHYSIQRIKEFLASETPRATRLRRSSPFFAVLTAEERETLMEMLEDRG